MTQLIVGIKSKKYDIVGLVVEMSENALEQCKEAIDQASRMAAIRGDTVPVNALPVPWPIVSELQGQIGGMLVDVFEKIEKLVAENTELKERIARLEDEAYEKG